DLTHRPRASGANSTGARPTTARGEPALQGLRGALHRVAASHQFASRRGILHRRGPETGTARAPAFISSAAESLRTCEVVLLPTRSGMPLAHGPQDNGWRAHDPGHRSETAVGEIGRASCRERGWVEVGGAR